MARPLRRFFSPMKQLLHIVFATLLLTACGGRSGPSKLQLNKIQLRVEGKDLLLEVKSGVIRIKAEEQVMRDWTTATYDFILANYEINRNGDMPTLNKPEDLRVFFRIYGKKGTDKNTAPRPGVYKAEAKEIPKFVALAIITVVDGKIHTTLSTNSPDTVKGQVKIISVVDDTVEGEIDISSETTIAAKGSFTAKIRPQTF